MFLSHYKMPFQRDLLSSRITEQLILVLHSAQILLNVIGYVLV